MGTILKARSGSIPGERTVATASLRTPPERRMAAERRLLHDDEACALKVADNALGGDRAMYSSA
jgi:hypothetical protein